MTNEPLTEDRPGLDALFLRWRKAALIGMGLVTAVMVLAWFILPLQGMWLVRLAMLAAIYAVFGLVYWRHWLVVKKAYLSGKTARQALRTRR